MKLIAKNILEFLGIKKIVKYNYCKYVQLPKLTEFRQAKQIISNSKNVIPPKKGKKALFFTMRGWTTHVVWESVIAKGLQIRGADCVFYTCGSGLPICETVTCHYKFDLPCAECSSYTKEFLKTFNLKYHELRNFVDEKNIKEADEIVKKIEENNYRNFVYNGLNIGKYAETSVQWFLCGGKLKDDLRTKKIYREFLRSSILIAKTAERMLDNVKPDLIIMLNGLFFAERIMWETAKAKKIPVVTYERGFIIDTVVFEKKHPVGCFNLDEEWEKYKNVSLTKDENKTLDDYLLDRTKGERSIEQYWPKVEEDKNKIIQFLNIDKNKKVVILFSNILWDTALQDKDTAFANMGEWIIETINYFMKNPDKQLIIRVHPAEVRLIGQETTEKVQDLIYDYFPELPGNVRIIPSESDISSYVLMSLSDTGIVYTSTAGLELALNGVPSVVCGETHYMNKGFTYDVADKNEYFKLLEKAMDTGKIGKEKVELARRYAYLFFFRYSIHFDLVSEKEKGKLILNFNSLNDLLPGKNKSLDRICDYILGD